MCAPLSPVYRVPIIVLVGEIVEKPWAVDGRVEPGRSSPSGRPSTTGGSTATGMSEAFQKYLANTLAYEP